MELKAAIEGNLLEIAKAEVKAGEEAAQAAIATVSGLGKQRLRDQVTGAGMGQRLGNAWRNDVYPKRGASLNAAALVWTKAPVIVDAFNRGVEISAAGGGWLAIPTDAVPRSIMAAVGGDQARRKRSTPELIEQAMGIKLRFVPPNGRRPALLVMDDAALTKAGRARGAAKGKIAKGHVTTVVMFILVKQVRLPKRFDIARVENQMADELPAEFLRQWQRLAP
jgi:hypothetical protein